MTSAISDTMKGYILTMEAVLSLMVTILFISSLPLLFSEQKEDLSSFVLLSDSFEVLEKGYHSEFATWTNAIDLDSSDLVDSKIISDYFTFIKNETGKRVFLRYKSKSLPYYGCITGLSLKKTIVTSTGIKNISISLCAD